MAMGPFDESAKERLSALADGELDGAERASACAAWAADPAARRDWHAWHLIGDVLRSEDLATDPRRDRVLCAAIRARLQTEPVVLAPGRAPAARRSRWGVGGAMAAGVALVVGTFAVLRPVSDPPSSVVAQAERPSASPVVAPAPPAPGRQAAADELVVADMRLIRDAQLDRYLAAHKQFAGTSALGVPSAFLRSATVDTASR
jgi:sigma-E factor negative regulatory protein RseA